MSPFWQLLFRLQAQRRLIERDALMLGGALCIAAQHFPHQVANVKRVLTHLEVRHLLADEVGLGKTVQAMMVLNALRLQRPGLRTLIIVPNALEPQWRDELRSRSHEVPIDSSPQEGVDRFTRLAWPKTLNLADLSATSYDLVIVDEPQELPKSLKERLTQIAPDLQGLLILTATPELSVRTQADDLVSLLEPSRAEAALLERPDESVLDSLGRRERDVFRALGSEDTSSWETFGGAPPGTAEQRVVTAAQAHATLRRVIRARRKDFPWNLPQRRAHVILIEPLETEVERQRVMWQYLDVLGDLTREIDPYLLAQRVARSRSSLRQRVTYLIGHGHDRNGLLAQVDKLLNPVHGDSRFDALCDLLRNIWDEEPRARVVVAAGDNLTVEDLAKRLEALFQRPDNAGIARPIKLQRILNQSPGPDSLVDKRDVLAQAQQDFVEGEAELLLAAEAGGVGLNLQSARHLIFYSMPWNPQLLEQWVGRVDRLGSAAMLHGGSGDERTVELYFLVQRDLVDERVATVIQATGLLEHNISLDGQSLARIEASLHDAALNKKPAGWEAACETARSCASHADPEETLQLPLSRKLPYTPASARGFFKQLQSAHPLKPAFLVDQSSRGLHSIEEALNSWLYAMNMAGEYHYMKAKHGHPATLKYPQKLTRVNGLQDLATVPLDEQLIPYPGGRSVYFHLHRGKLRHPPCREHTLPDGDKRPLYFLDHGSPLHDSLVTGWKNHGADNVDAESGILQVPESSPVAELGNCVMVLEVATVTPSELLSDLDGETRHWTEADRRFLSSLLPAQLLVSGFRLTHEKAQALAVPEPLLWKLLEPTCLPGQLITYAKWSPPYWLDLSDVKRAQKNLAPDLQQKARANWREPLVALEVAIAQRCYQLEVQEQDEERLAALRREALELRPSNGWLRQELRKVELTARKLKAALVSRREALLSSQKAAQSPPVKTFFQAVFLIRVKPAQVSSSSSVGMAPDGGVRRHP